MFAVFYFSPDVPFVPGRRQPGVSGISLAMNHSEVSPLVSLRSTAQRCASE